MHMGGYNAPGKERGKGRTDRVKGENQAVIRLSFSTGLTLVPVPVRIRGQDREPGRRDGYPLPFFPSCQAW